jgi:hypothetical protein
MKPPTITITFKKTEMELYNKIKSSSTSPPVFIKDVMTEYFKSISGEPNYQPKRRL